MVSLTFQLMKKKLMMLLFQAREYMAGVRTFPSLVNELFGINTEAWTGFTAYTKPFLTERLSFLLSLILIENNLTTQS